MTQAQPAKVPVWQSNYDELHKGLIAAAAHFCQANAIPFHYRHAVETAFAMGAVQGMQFQIAKSREPLECAEAQKFA